MIALEIENIEIMEELLDAGAEVERQKSRVLPNLVIAAFIGHVDAVKLPRKYNADPDAEVRVKKRFFSSEKTLMGGKYFESGVRDKRKQELMRPLGVERYEIIGYNATSGFHDLTFQISPPQFKPSKCAECIEQPPRSVIQSYTLMIDPSTARSAQRQLHSPPYGSPAPPQPPHNSTWFFEESHISKTTPYGTPHRLPDPIHC
ncbi:MAG: hypothetical protein ASARMPRED_009297 [Alectoria sarmentosa]|nr:MAG: hypothetical protein ASARMPRED_009297 [Alectoria sarmentosa]